MGTFGERLKIALELRGKRPIDLCNDLKINKGNLSNYLNDKIPAPKVKTAEKLANYLDVNVFWLLGYTDNMSSQVFGISPLSTRQAVGLEPSKDDLMKQTLMDDISAICSRQDLETLKTMYGVIKTLAKK